MAQAPKKPSAPDKAKPAPGKKRPADARGTVRKHEGPVPVIGLGASAGGLQALSDFFKAMPDNTGLAFVVIHHADPDHKSLMAEILSKDTKMSVAFATDQSRIEPDHVYVIPPNHSLGVKDGALHLSAPVQRRGLRLPIDYFFRALASDQKQNAVGIILSGTGGDGTAGIRSIKENGGMVLVQDPKEAAHGGMPRSTIASGSVDHVLRVDKMPAAIIDYVAHPYISKGNKPHVLGTKARDSLAEITNLLKTYTDINFEFYKEGTLLRRIERRMALRHMENSIDYLALLKDSPDEAKKLCADLLISVTSFFRDGEAFDCLAKTVIPELVKKCAPGKPIRIWVPACATGEEAYSLAMLMIEKISGIRKDVKLQVFASDVDEHALAIARAGVYPDAIAADMSRERLNRFFIKEDHSYCITPELRNAVVFASQNILADAPFSKLDLISCRNLLIYLNADAQARIIKMFHFALNDEGVLFLGYSETATNYEAQFQPISKKYRLYKRVGMTGRGHFELPVSRPVISGAPVSANRAAMVGHGQKLADISQKILVEQYAPAAVLIDARMETLYFHGPIDEYLKVPTGEAKQGLWAMARQGLRTKLGSAIREALQTRHDVTISGVVTRKGQKTNVSIGAHPVVVDDETLVLVTFVDQPTAAERSAPHATMADTALQTHLEQELESTRLELQSTIRDYELSAEELKASNEEAMSMNEEFQSTNEELETSKEELQSLNEELTTLNTQLQQKVEDERSLLDDLNNVLSSSGIATLFLDRKLNIMRFTPAIRELFNVIANDVGRPFSDITGRTDDANLLPDARKVLNDLTPIDRDVQSEDGKWFIRRILPYRTQDGKIDGVVITFSDVTELKTLQQEARAAQLFSESIVDTIREPLLVLDKDFRIVRASHSYLTMFNTTSKEIQGKILFDVQSQQWDQPALRKLLEAILPEQQDVESYEIDMQVEGQKDLTLIMNARKIEDAINGHNLILLAAEDVTIRLQSQSALEEREARLSALLDASPEAIITIDDHGIVRGFSSSASSMLGYSADEVLGRNVSMLMSEPYHSKHDSYLSHYRETGEKQIIGTGRELNALHKNGTEVPMRLTVAEFWFDGRHHFTGMMHDLTEDMKSRNALQQAQKMEAIGQLTGGLAHDFNNLLTIITGNLELLEMNLGNFPKRDLLEEALEASDLGAKLTAQLLAFSRKQALKPETVPLNKLVMDIKSILSRTLGEQIRIKTDLSDDLYPTLTDPGQIEMAILNLAINARDAMSEGGTLTIMTRNVTLDKDYAATQVDVEPGPYVALSVTDSGCGMAPSVTQRVFEPFFTTKDVGAGSGLGLSMVYGFAKQSGGHVAIYSEEGQGTTVTLYLPPALQDCGDGGGYAQKGTPESGSETILVVEDDPSVRRLTVNRLEGLGYTVLAAKDGPAALELLRADNQIDLILSDIVMPGGLTGFDVANQALQINPDLKILLATGYASGWGAGHGQPGTDYPILRKPYGLSDLSSALRDLLK